MQHLEVKLTNLAAKGAILVEDFVYLKQEEAFQPQIHRDKVYVYKLTNKQKRQFQHEFKIHLGKYFKGLLGKGADSLKVTISDDMVILRGERFLTQPETYIASTPKGNDLVKASRLQIAEQFALDNVSYFEEKLEAKCIQQTFNVEPSQDYWIHVMVFDQLLSE